MTLTELMIEHTPPRLVESAAWPGSRSRRDWFGWLVKRLDWLGGHTDWNRKV